MRTSTETWPGRIALMVGHCAGMVDLVALPVWVGALIAWYHFEPQRAGGLATLFLISAVVSSLVFAPRLNRINGRVAAIAGFGVAALAMLVATFTTDYATLAVLHVIGGFSAACGLSFTHGTIAHSSNPHRLFAYANLAIGVFGVIFLGVTPNLIAAFGGPALFAVFTVIFVVAAIIAALLFPTTTAKGEAGNLLAEVGRLRPAVWFGVAGVSCMALNQAMMFSFLERVGIDHGFGRSAVTGVLIVLGFVTLIPAPLAAIFEKRLPPRGVLMTGPVLQVILVFAITLASAFPLYAVAAVLYAPVMIFTHTFAFGVLSKLDPSARALAGTPAMLMIGAAIGPILGGTLVQFFGYPSLGVAALIISACAVTLYSRVQAPAVPVAAAQGAVR